MSERPEDQNIFEQVPGRLFRGQDWTNFSMARDGIMGSPRHKLRAYGGLTYLQFITVLAKMWEDGHPDIPVRAHGTDEQNPTYPAIIYSLELRQPIQSEPKAKIREIYTSGPGTTDDDALVIKGQRFQNIIKFQVTTIAEPTGAQQAERIVEEFEDFMMEMTPIFKKLGVSEMFYARRLSDAEENRMGLGVINRSITYAVYLEKVVATPMWKVNQIEIDARRFLEENEFEQTHHATPNVTISVTDQLGGFLDATPDSDDPDTEFGLPLVPPGYSGHLGPEPNN